MRGFVLSSSNVCSFPPLANRWALRWRDAPRLRAHEPPVCRPWMESHTQ